MKWLVFVFLLLLQTETKSQICNFCNIETVKSILLQEKIEFYEKLEPSGELTLNEKTDGYSKTWHFRYDRCLLFEVCTFNRKYFKSMKRNLNKQFIKSGKNAWDGPENTINLVFTSKGHRFTFWPKNTTLQGVSKN